MVRFVKGSFSFEYKNDFDEDFIELDFVQKSALKNMVNYPDNQKSQRSIQISNWQTLPESEISLDLINEEEY